MVSSTVPRSPAICLFNCPEATLDEHFPFAGRERCQPPQNVVQLGARLPRGRVLLDGDPNGPGTTLGAFYWRLAART